MTSSRAAKGDQHRGLEEVRRGRSQPGNTLGSPQRVDKDTAEEEREFKTYIKQQNDF